MLDHLSCFIENSHDGRGMTESLSTHIFCIMSSTGYLQIDTSESPSSLLHFERGEYRSGKLTFWAILALCLCGFVILRWKLVFFGNGKGNNTREASITGTYPLKSHQFKRIHKKIRAIHHIETEKERIRQSIRIIESKTKCIGRCIGNCTRGTSDCIFSCTSRCKQPLSPFPITKASRIVQKKILPLVQRGTEGKTRVTRKAHNVHFDEKGVPHTQYYEWRRVHCVCRFCLHVAEYCSMLGKHLDSSCDEDLQQCEIEHCGVDEVCVQIVHDGMENEPIIAVIRVLEVCLDAGLFYS